MTQCLIKVIASAILITMLLPQAVFAARLPALPKVSTPELPELPQPKLSQSYENMLKELEEAGFGQYKYDPDKPLPFPEVEAPTGAGNSATKRFLQEFGDVWNDKNHQLNVENIMPDDDFFEKHTGEFQAISQLVLDEVRMSNDTELKEKMQNTLDMSILYDLGKLKSGFASISASAQSAWMAGTPKPAGYDAIVTKANTPAPKINIRSPQDLKQVARGMGVKTDNDQFNVKGGKPLYRRRRFRAIVDTGGSGKDVDGCLIRQRKGQKY